MGQFSKFDMDVADRLGRVEESIGHLHGKLDMVLDNDLKWKENVTNKLEYHSGLFKWAAGVLATIHAAFVAVLSYFRGQH